LGGGILTIVFLIVAVVIILDVQSDQISATFNTANTINFIPSNSYDFYSDSISKISLLQSNITMFLQIKDLD